MTNFLGMDPVTDPLVRFFYQVDTWSQPRACLCDSVCGHDGVCWVVAPKEWLIGGGKFLIFEQILQFWRLDDET